MKKLALLLCVSLPLALGTACSKSESGEEGGGSGGGGGGESSEVSLDALGLKAKAPSGSKVKDAPVGDGVMIQGPGIVVTVEEATDKPETIEEAKSDADMYSPQNIETEELDDGFAMSFTNEGSAGENYWVNVRREIGGKAYWCTTTAHSEKQQKNALAACKSLSK